MSNDRTGQELSVLVTGSSSGFGDVIVRTLARAGYHVFATMREAQGRNRGAAAGLETWAKASGVSLSVLEMDVADDASVGAAVASILDAGGHIDIVVNNAGIAAAGPIEAFDSDQVYQLFNVNAFGPIRVDRAVLPHMRLRGSGLLLHVSSTLGRILPGGGGLYPATKWALEGLAESLRYQVAPFEIDVVILEPGSFPTPAVSRGMLPANEEVARDYAAQGAASRRSVEPSPDYRPPDIQEVADAVLRIVDMPAGQRDLRYVVGPIFTEGVDEFNQQYEAAKARLTASLQRPDQAITWGRRQPEPSASGQAGNS